MSDTFGRRDSTNSSRLSTYSYQDSVHLQDLGRTPSVYSHQRDTQFDEYMAARASKELKDNIDRAMAAEFGWTASPSSAHTDSDLFRRDSTNSIVMGSGTVASAVARPRGDSVVRATSYDSMGLAAVPEMAEEEEEEGQTTPTRKSNGAGDTQALMTSHSRNNSDASDTITVESEAGDLGQRKRKWEAGS